MIGGRGDGKFSQCKQMFIDIFPSFIVLHDCLLDAFICVQYSGILGGMIIKFGTRLLVPHSTINQDAIEDEWVQPETKRLVMGITMIL